MFLKHLPTSGLVEVLDFNEVFDPFAASIRARSQAGEDTMDEDLYPKAELVFPSGVPLPLCWRDSKYREHIAA